MGKERIAAAPEAPRFDSHRLRDKAPEGLIPWIREQKDIAWKNYLIYKHDWYREPITGLRKPCAKAVCSACGEEMILSKAYGVDNKWGNATFGIGFYNGSEYKQYGSGETCRCPECGAEVEVLHSSAANNLVRYCWPMSFERDGKDLICYLWRVERQVEKNGKVDLWAHPWEAYVFGEKTAVVHKRWYSSMFNGCYPANQWETLSRFHDRAYDIGIVYCPEGIEAATKGTWMENSKLELYMAVKGEFRFPIVWLKIFQRRGAKAETLMTCGAGKLAAGIIAEEKCAQSYYQDWTVKIDCLKDLDWSKKKPTEILRVSKDELGYFRKLASKDGCRRLRVIQQARKKGYAIRPGDEDGVWGTEEQLELLQRGVMPIKARKYLSRQKARYKRECELGLLRDYWNMAEQLHMDLNDTETRWPQNLRSMHDQLVERLKEVKDQKNQAAFDKRFEKMKRYSWEHDGIMIRPARSQKELREEGKTLHHCVATYGSNHAAGKLTIFFIRRIGEPDKPWFTLNFNEKSLSVTENRGLYNCARTPEIEAFEAAWLEWVRAGCKREKKKEAHAA